MSFRTLLNIKVEPWNVISLDFVLGGPTEKFFVCYNVIQKFTKNFVLQMKKIFVMLITEFISISVKK